jgi:integrase
MTKVVIIHYNKGYDEGFGDNRKKNGRRTAGSFCARRPDRNRKAYAHAAGDFAAWCAEHGLFELVAAQVVPVNPDSAVRGPKHIVRKGKTPVLSADEAHVLLSSIDTTSPVGLRDRALMGMMVYPFARVGAVTKMRVEDVYVQGCRGPKRERYGRRSYWPYSQGRYDCRHDGNSRLCTVCQARANYLVLTTMPAGKYSEANGKDRDVEFVDQE